MAEDDDEQQRRLSQIDQMWFRYPGGKIYVSGKNASKAFWIIGLVAVIIALGYTLPRVISAMGE